MEGGGGDWLVRLFFGGGGVLMFGFWVFGVGEKGRGGWGWGRDLRTREAGGGAAGEAEWGHHAAWIMVLVGTVDFRG